MCGSNSFPQLWVRLRHRGFLPRDRLLRDVHVSSFARGFEPLRARPRFFFGARGSLGCHSFFNVVNLGQMARSKDYIACARISEGGARLAKVTASSSHKAVEGQHIATENMFQQCGHNNGTFCELPRTPSFNVGAWTAARMPRQSWPGRTNHRNSMEWRAHHNASTLKWGVGGRSSGLPGTGEVGDLGALQEFARNGRTSCVEPLGGLQ